MKKASFAIYMRKNIFNLHANWSWKQYRIYTQHELQRQFNVPEYCVIVLPNEVKSERLWFIQNV